MGFQHYTQDMSKIPLKYHKKVLFYTKYTHPTLICRGTHGRLDARTDGRTHARMENIYSIFRDKLLLRGEHELCKLLCIKWLTSRIVKFILEVWCMRRWVTLWHLKNVRTTSTTDESRVKTTQKHKSLTNTITMVVEPLAPPAAWIWWSHAAWGVGVSCACSFRCCHRSDLIDSIN